MVNPFKWFSKQAPEAVSEPPVMQVDELNPFALSSGGGGNQIVDFNGDKFFNGFGQTLCYLPDYWELRNRSMQLFRGNLYARGLIRRMVTNIINTGLTVEATPEEAILGLEEDSLADWSENTENRFSLWAKNPHLCDYQGLKTFGELQSSIKRQALISGDVLVVLRTSPDNGLPLIQIIDGSAVQTPLGQQFNAKIEHGIELDKRRRHVAYHIQQEDNTSRRLPAFAPKTGRRLAWLVYGTDKMHDDVRGEPLLAIVLQSLREIDRYRDSAQRKAVVNSIFAMFIKKGVNTPGSLPITGGATRNDTATITDGDAAQRNFTLSQHIPGQSMQELAVGEEPVFVGGQGTDINFPVFETAIIQAVAWANEVPPEILTLAFSNNYSASQAAINEFKIFLNKERTRDGSQYCQPIYMEWLLAETLSGNILAPGLLAAWRDPRRYDIFAAWLSSDWSGAIKPSTDVLKQAKGYEKLIEIGAITRDRTSKELTGTKFSKNVQKLKRENAALADAARPMLELQAEFGEEAVEKVTAELVESVEEIEECLEQQST